MIHFIPCIPWSRSHFQCVSRLSRLTKMLPAAVLWENLTCQTLAMVKEPVAIESRMSILHAAPPIRNGMVARLVWPIPLSLREPAVVLRLIWTATTRIPASHWGHSSARYGDNMTVITQLGLSHRTGHRVFIPLVGSFFCPHTTRATPTSNSQFQPSINDGDSMVWFSSTTLGESYRLHIRHHSKDVYVNFGGPTSCTRFCVQHPDVSPSESLITQYSMLQIIPVINRA